MSPEVSFVIPCYNYGRFLDDCLRSILHQEGEWDFEVVAVDDCSTDNTLEILESYSTDSRVRVIRHERNQGHVVAMSRGLTEARGQYVARIDPDDRYRPGFLNATVPKLRQYPEVGMVHGEVAVIDGHGNPHAAWRKAGPVRSGDTKGNEFVAMLKRNCVHATTVIARREAWMQALPVPPRLSFSDWWFNLQIARRYELYYVNAVIADYRVHGANHHARVAIDGTEEASVVDILNRIFSETEADAGLEASKRAMRGPIYAQQYLAAAEKYFVYGNHKDARRCFWNAFRAQPASLLSARELRCVVGSFLKPEWYGAGRAFWRRVRHRPST